MRHGISTAVLALALLVPAAVAAQPSTTLLPGTVGLSQKDVPVRNACGGAFRSIKQVKKGDAATFVVAMTHARLTGLDMDPARPARAKVRLKPFGAWFKPLAQRFGAGRKVQERAIFDPAATAQTKAEAAARMVLLLEQAALLIDTVEIPANVRKLPETADAFCDTLDEHAEPLRNNAAEARQACARIIADGALPVGWWTPVCLPPLAPTTPIP